MFNLDIAIRQPGMFLSQPPIAIKPSKRSAWLTVSMESAITSLEFKENFMPSVPIDIPSLTVMVPKVMPAPLELLMPALASIASLSMCILQGVRSLQVEATPIIGFLKSSSLKPTALSMPLLGARLSPSVMTVDFILRVLGILLVLFVVGPHYLPYLHSYCFHVMLCKVVKFRLHLLEPEFIVLVHPVLCEL